MDCELEKENSDISQNVSTVVSPPKKRKSPEGGYPLGSATTADLTESATSAEGGEGFESFEYVASEQLQGCDDPTSDSQGLLDVLRNEHDWIPQFHAITTVRRLTLRSRELFLPMMDTVVPLIVQCGKSLRSQIAKNAMMCIADLCTTLPDLVPLDGIVPVLLATSASDKKFIRESALAALQALIACGARALLPLLGSASAKSPKVSSKAAECVEAIVRPMGAAIGEYCEMSALLRGFVLFAEGKLAETRRIGKRLIEMLCVTVGRAKLDALVAGALTAAEAARLGPMLPAVQE